MVIHNLPGGCSESELFGLIQEALVSIFFAAPPCWGPNKGQVRETLVLSSTKYINIYAEGIIFGNS